MKGYEITLKKALNREPEKLKSLYNSVLSGFYFRESRYQAYNKNLKAAKEFLKASISLTPLKISLYLFWLLLPVAHQIYSILKKK